jgi:hypothetical protein
MANRKQQEITRCATVAGRIVATILKDKSKGGHLIDGLD